MKVKVVIVGANGYSGEELIRILLNHPHAQLEAITSRSHAGKSLAEVFPKFGSHSVAHQLQFIKPAVDHLLKLCGGKAKQSSVVFLALPHGVAAEWAIPLCQENIRVIDLSADFRLKDAAVYREFYGHPHPAPGFLNRAVYGLPEIYRTAIRKSHFIASPGCYPTSILLPLIPLLRSGLIKSHGIIANSLSGISGAGRKTEEPYLYCECNESARPYSAVKHRHISEIEQELSRAAKKPVIIQFTPHLIPVNRGILTTIYVRPEEKLKDVSAIISRCYQRAYGKESFIRLLNAATLPDLKNVVNTNVIEIAHRMDLRTGRLILFSAEDNLTKGASGQAVQSMNIMFGFPETAGLKGC